MVVGLAHRILLTSLFLECSPWSLRLTFCMTAHLRLELNRDRTLSIVIEVMITGYYPYPHVMASSLQFGLSPDEQYIPPNIYSSVDTSKREIRLILLGDDIELHSHSLDAVPPYHAISYHWGPAAPTCHVMIQGNPIKIRESVREMLEVLKEIYGCEVYFWVDMPCINQLDLHERNSQVAMMAEIYSCASDVVSWLGPSTPQSRCAFEIIERELIACKMRRSDSWGTTA